MTYEEWAATVGRGVTITPEMAFEAGAAIRDAEIAELVAALESARAMIGHPDNIAIIDATLAKVRKP